MDRQGALLLHAGCIHEICLCPLVPEFIKDSVPFRASVGMYR